MKKLCFFVFILFSFSAIGQWTVINSGISTTLTSVDFLDADVGLVCGTNKIWKTINGGQTWSTVYTGSQQIALEEVVWVKQNVAMAVGFNFAANNAYILRSFDGGNNWESVSVNQISFLTDIYFVDASIGYICGGNTTILKTTNGGSNWTLSLNTNDSDLFSIVFTSPSKGYAAGGIDGFSRVLRTTNGGSTWSDATDGSISQRLLGIDFPSDDIGYAVGELGYLIKSEDAGATWSELSTTLNNDAILDVKFVDTLTGYIVGGTNLIANIQKTTDGGETWVQEAPASAKGLYCIDITPGTGFAVGVDGTIVKAGIITSVFNPEEEESSILVFPTLVSQNVTIESKEEPIQRVEIYDRGGRSVRQMGFFSNKIEINMADLPASNYYLKIKTAGEVIVKKVMKF